MPQPADFSGRLQEELHLLRVGIQNAFVALLPYLILNALLTLTRGFLPYLSAAGSQAWMQGIGYLADSVQALFPLCILLSIAYHLAKQYSVSRHGSVILALICHTVGSNWAGYSAFNSAENLYTGALSMLAVPLLSTLSLRYFWALLKDRPPRGQSVSLEVNSALGNILPLVCAFIFTLLALVLLAPVARQTGNYLGNWQHESPTSEFMFVLSLGSHLAWFLGIHGDQLMSMLFRLQILQTPMVDALSYRQYYDLFVIPGGSGGMASLLLALWLSPKDRQSRRIVRLAAPFVACNISEILIFGLPVILNRQLLLPFLLVPLCNMGLTWIFITHHWLGFQAADLPSSTPLLLNAWLHSGGQWPALLLQAGCITLGTCIYLPFVRRYLRQQSSSHQRYELASALSLSAQFDRLLAAKSRLERSTLAETHQEIEGIIESFKRNRLAIYYQPKINLEHSLCSHFEALLRLEMQSGEVLGPYFLKTIESAGLASVLDLWVCHEIRRHLQAWRDQDFRPRISINLHPESVLDRSFIEEIAQILEGESIDFELVERADLDLEIARANLDYLHSQGFRVSLDDFGVGYAGLAPINTLPLDAIKFDKSLIDATVSARGCTIYTETVRLCRELGMECTAEGIETEEQVRFLQETGIKYIQGFYYAPALPPDAALRFSREHIQPIRKAD